MSILCTGIGNVFIYVFLFSDFSEFVYKMIIKIENKVITVFRDEWVPGFMEIIL